jgi:hypothetical protein
MVFGAYLGSNAPHVESDPTELELPPGSPRKGSGEFKKPKAPDSKDALYPNRIVLTTYPGGANVNPIPLNWGAASAEKRGPIIASRHPQSLSLRNSIGAHGGSYSIYRALAVAMGELNPQHRPNLVNTEPVVEIKPSKSWYLIFNFLV